MVNPVEQASGVEQASCLFQFPGILPVSIPRHLACFNSQASCLFQFPGILPVSIPRHLACFNSQAGCPNKGRRGGK
ncbi:hypothetical protein [Moorena sp. SIO4G3]|uniref:hypothetical protein n=1 Tax=Moorena sp. SIO4G3 TaxID=2607821 RepID=UPI00142AB041|nr:hypothetical protein [Moorena sp. SIO4G3]NEO81513.1 hypothetical protein [Moorena sp. SIO4G3]